MKKVSFYASCFECSGFHVSVFHWSKYQGVTILASVMTVFFCWRLLKCQIWKVLWNVVDQHVIMYLYAFFVSNVHCHRYRQEKTCVVRLLSKVQENPDRDMVWGPRLISTTSVAISPRMMGLQLEENHQLYEQKSRELLYIYIHTLWIQMPSYLDGTWPPKSYPNHFYQMATMDPLL